MHSDQVHPGCAVTLTALIVPNSRISALVLSGATKSSGLSNDFFTKLATVTSYIIYLSEISLYTSLENYFSDNYIDHKKLIVVFLLTFSGFSYGDGVNEWQDIELNVNKLNSLNAYNSCVLWNTNFQNANLANASLSGVNFITANLAGATLSNANLEGSSLFGANLNGANLEKANLFAVNLYGANLSGANLTGVDMSTANLSSVNFASANLTDANLRGADLSDAIIEGAFLCNTIMLWGIDNSSC